jgi:SAM-dependent methyltransferase
VSAQVTGERVSTAQGGFNPTYQRHVAAYRLAARLLPPGSPVLDLGCGTGHSFAELAPRRTFGVDADAGALAGQDRPTFAADMRATPFDEEVFAGVVCVHAIEHVPDPENVAREAARVLRDDGVAVFVTPNRLTFARPDEIIDPYHEVELDPRELHDVVAVAFEQVEVHGLFGTGRYLDLVAGERRQLERLLRLDPLRLRRLLPRRVRRGLYDHRLRSARLRNADARAAGITPDDFYLGRTDLEACLDVVAVAARPRRPAGPGAASR